MHSTKTPCGPGLLRLLLTGSLLVLPPAGVFAGPAAGFSFGNARVVRDFVPTAGGGWRTSAFRRLDDGFRLPVEDGLEFSIRLADGTDVTSEAYSCETPAGPPPPSAPVAGNRGRTMDLVFAARENAPAGAPRRVTVRYEVRENEDWIRKTVLLDLPAGAAVDELCVENLRTAASAEQGGKGEPVFLGTRFYVGLEHPAGFSSAGTNGQVRLYHFPGVARALDGSSNGVIRSMTAVAALAPKDLPVRAFFGDYLDTIRLPPRNHLHYNSWYDLRGKEVNPTNLLEIYRGYKKNLSDPYGVPMDTFVPDDGWQEKDSLWVPRAPDFTGGLSGLASALSKEGGRLGLWLPLNGYLLNPDWGESNGLERAFRDGKKQPYYCLVATNYNAAIRGALDRLIRGGNLGYMKHDFNHLQCDAPGHGHPAGASPGHEASVEAQLDLLAWERSLMPDIFLNVTSYCWHSPWWLMHADSIWMCAGDHGFDNTFPQISPRQWEMSYRDAHFFKLLREQKHLVPLSAYMTHGIIYGRYERIGDERETLREWSDAALMYVGRGVQLKELYVDPSMPAPSWWKALGETLRWSIARAPLLERVAMVGGDPRKGEPYGYLHWKGDSGLLVARNPGLAAGKLEVVLDANVGCRVEAGRDHRLRAVYPFCEELPVGAASGRLLSVLLPGDFVGAYEILPGRPRSSRATAPTAPVQAMASATGDRLTVQIRVPGENMGDCLLRLLIHGAALPDAAPAVTVNGKPVGVRAASGPGWSLRDIDLRPWRGREAVVVAAVPPGPEALFTPDFRMAAWLVADREVRRPEPAPGETLPFRPAQQLARETRSLCAETEFKVPRASKPVAVADLADIRAAKLRILVFDVNAGPGFGKKSVFLNGKRLAPVPANTGGLSAWSEKWIDIPADQLAGLKLDNEVHLDNADGDYYKVKGLALAVQLKDGTWAATPEDPVACTSVVPWAYEEGRPFEKGRSPVIRLSFADGNESK